VDKGPFKTAVMPVIQRMDDDQTLESESDTQASQKFHNPIAHDK
jgi:hypothetical protein